MKALVFNNESGLRLRQVDEPQVSEGEVLIHVSAVGVCGSDISRFRGGMPYLPTPMVPGHEFSGTLDNGQQVVVNPMIGCGVCRRCAAGNTHICEQRQVIGMTRDGAYAERVAVPWRNVVRVDGLDPARAALVEPIANGVHGWHRAGRPSGSLAIIGSGSIGMCLLHVLRCQGITDITMVDPIAERLDAARAAGASGVMTRLVGQFDAVFDAAGTEETRVDALACTVFGGTTALLGLHDDVLKLSASVVIVGDRSIAGCFGYSEGAFQEAVKLAASIDLSWTASVSIDAAQDAVAALIAGRSAPGTIKTMIRFAP